jgi:thioredoxin reductase (NADPH)
VEYGTRVFTETVDAVDLSAGSPFRLETGTKVVLADALIIATGAAAKRLRIPGSDEANGFWNKGISACAVCDGSSPLFR